MTADPPLLDARRAADLLARGGALPEGLGPAALDWLWRGDAPDERLRAAVRVRLEAMIGAVERELRLGAARRLAEMQAVAAAERLLDDTVPLVTALGTMAGHARARLLADIVDDVRLDLLAADLPAGSPAGDRPSLLVRLAECPEAHVAALASELLALTGQPSLPTPSPRSRSALVWWCAAALRERVGAERRADHALVEAAEEWLAEPTPVTEDDAAARLAAAIAARPDELPGLLAECLGDRRPELFVAVLAQASGLDTAAVRAMVLDPEGERLLLLFRVHDIDRASVARIGVALADADGRRDLARFADRLDAAMAITPEDAAALFDPLHLPPEYRAARAELARAR